MENLTREKLRLRVLIQQFGLKRNSIDERLRTQKIVWLFQNSISQIGYGFRWYIHGPYSKDLSDACYDVMIKDKKAYDIVNFKLPEDTQGKFNAFKSKIDTICKDDSSYNLLEAVASIDFISKDLSNRNDIDCENMFNELKTYKKTYHNGVSVDDPVFFKKAFEIWERDFKSKVA